MSELTASIIWGMGIVAWLIIRIPHRRRAGKTAVVKNRKSAQEQLALSLCIVGLVVVPIIHLLSSVFEFANYGFHPLMGWAGALLLAGFLMLFYLCHKHLARNWSVTLEIRENHELVQTGVYKYIRHPMYTSFWLWGIAQMLLIPNWIAGLSGLLSVAWLYFSRIEAEEAMMKEQFGSAYEEYSSKTYRLLPKLIQN